MQTFEQNQSDIANWLMLQSKTVQKECVVVNSEELGQNFMLHIDKKTPNVFVPQMPRSAALSEDNTTPRISVSSNLLGCLIGYARGDNDFFNGTTKRFVSQTGYRGGYEINEIEFTHCIKPNDRIVFDSSRSLEYWLVNYNKETIEYKSRQIGKVFISSITSVACVGDEPSSLLTIYIEHSKIDGINFTPNNFLKPGHYRATVLFINRLKQDVNKEEDFKVEPISENEYLKAKGLSASMLEFKEKIPYMSW